MSNKGWLVLGAIGLLAAVLPAIWVDAPGYMDADYYMATALRLVEGHGLSEPFLWNYLDDPQSLPHPSHLYWMPLTTFVAAGPMVLFGPGFRSAQIPFLLMTASLPLVAAWFAGRLGGRRRHMWVAGGLAAASGFFLPFFVTTDAFALYALLGGLIFALAGPGSSPKRPVRWALVGIVVGLGHLARADGFLLLLPAGFMVLQQDDGRGRAGLVLLLGYLTVMGPWMLRNLAVTGSPLAPGGARSLWLRSYDDLFRYPASTLNAAEFIEAGLGPVALDRARALGLNLISLLVVNGLVFLGPLAALGGWRRRSRSVVRAGAVYLGGLIFVMGVAFPYSGARGGFFHSSAGIMPLVWALAPLGLDDAVDWAAGRRGWRVEEAKRAFSVGAVTIAAAATVFLLVVRLVLPAAEGRGWGAQQQDYARVQAEMQESFRGRVAVNNPPGFWLATGMEAVVIPNGGEAQLERVVQEFQVDWVLLEVNHPSGLDRAYADPSRLTWADPVASVESHDGRPIWILRVNSLDE